MKTFFVYIITNKRNGTLYIGMTGDLNRRIGEHKSKEIGGFSKKYSLDKLVYFEELNSADEAFERERQMKKWNRPWKIRLIEEINPKWIDLAENW